MNPRIISIRKITVRKHKKMTESQRQSKSILDHIQRATIRLLVNFSTESVPANQQWNDI